MQYLLTQEMYDSLAPIKELHARDKALEAARKLIVKLAGVPCGESCCYKCPISWIGYSSDDTKEPMSKKSSELLCTLPRKYSK